MSKTITTRTPAQIRSHAQKYFERLAESKTNDAEEHEEGVVIVSCRGSKRSGMILNGSVQTPAAKKTRLIAEHSCEQGPAIRQVDVEVIHLPAIRRAATPVEALMASKQTEVKMKREDLEEQQQQQPQEEEEEEEEEEREEQQEEGQEEEEEQQEEELEGDLLAPDDKKRKPFQVMGENGMDDDSRSAEACARTTQHSGVVSPLQLIEIVSKMGEDDVQSPLHKSRTGEETLSAELNAIHVLASAFHEH
jgi:hypothetical protein